MAKTAMRRRSQNIEPALSFWPVKSNQEDLSSPFRESPSSFNERFQELCDTKSDVPILDPFAVATNFIFLSPNVEASYATSTSMLLYFATSLCQSLETCACGTIMHVSKLGRVQYCTFEMAAVILDGVLQEIMIALWPLSASDSPSPIEGCFVRPTTPPVPRRNTHNSRVPSPTLSSPSPPQSRHLKGWNFVIPELKPSKWSKRHSNQAWKCDFCAETDTPERRCRDFEIPQIRQMFLPKQDRTCGT